MAYDAKSIYDEMKTLLQNELNEIAYDTWFRNLNPISVDNDTLILETDNPMAIKIINTRYTELLSNCFEQLNYRGLSFSIVDKNSYVPEKSEVSMEELVKNANLNMNYTFNQFVKGTNNNLAYSAAFAVAEMPGHTDTPNPLFIWGGSGLGKTHLMQAIGIYILSMDPTKKVLYVSCETFMNEMIRAIGSGTQYKFQDKYRQIDVLLIDDIQFLGGKIGTQEEFFHTFNTLYEANKQIVISGDRPPEEIEHLEERIRSRFKWGMVADIKPPNYETRIAILQKKIENKSFGVTFDNSALSYIADNVSSNIRELEGALTRVAMFSRLYHEQLVDERIARDALKDYISTSHDNKVSLHRIVECVCEHYHLRLEDIRGKKRNSEIAYPRQIAMYLCRQMTDEPLINIGNEFGGRDHTTVMHAINKIKGDLTLAQGDELRRLLEDLQRRINGE